MSFTEILYEKGVPVILSGPVPYPSLSNQAFSRALAINEWLTDFCMENEIVFLDNFGFSSCKENCFMRNGNELNKRGSDMLGAAIFENLTAMSRS